ncbi:MAG: tRNA nucleotidyltransferase [Flavobacteriales bacterium CG03_land_8_20_14_0_80_35_15]|nr:HD domain-containing protein [Zetaproteobacteria bacterium]OIO08932.1 MAG: tRNA nucleotidyltransferase [Flavobacteriaceae bacterium CG1_02_35_72]PIR12820.1 MAG: tRNA nucleotidyltransferase [Flavobacteriales bacterium CG11_big_fil_rev_8_21_14_0_20_35_7]PIV18730.1 MAG: tRNA nucleotidyltransferase [Flavobacteriales bacterium CG03_land_8_20_14_0_80_35_15]PIX07448.1 MAG: tRNA nucleotidyltransferase [Flavobacteriales bacterium CG_4_8_14_3_um_filter_35_10]
MPNQKNHKQALELPIFKIISQVATSLQIDAYVIGGFVRDYLLQQQVPVKDIDVVAIGDGIELANQVAKSLPLNTKVQIFKTYGTAMLLHNGIAIEFVGARKESYQTTSRNPEVKPGSLEDDQNRRDFTMNALALSLNTSNYGDLIDPFNGLKDLKSKRIITPLEPKITFSDDPLRMLRAIRFASQLQFKIDPICLDAINKNAERIKIITNERIVDELNKILASKKPSNGFKLLHHTGLLKLILPELTALEGIEEVEGQSHKDNFYHTLEVLDNMAATSDDLWLRWAALLHDIGKAPTKKFSKTNGWTFHGHEFKGSKMVYQLFKRLKMPLNDKVKFVQKIVLMSSRPIVIAEAVTDSAVRRLIFDAGEDLEALMLHCEADITTKNPRRFKKYRDNFALVRQKIKEVETRDHVRNFQPPISGELIMETFSLKPCREIGLIKDAIKEAILEGKIKNDFDEAYQFMLKKGKALRLKKT